LLKPFIENFSEKLRNMEVILIGISDGLFVVDRDVQVHFMNQFARDFLVINFNDQSRHLIGACISNSDLPIMLQHQEKEVNEPLVLNNGTKIVSTRIPLINEQQHLIGAFAIFKDSQEILRLAEENTDLKEVKTMLEAIINSSDEAISVVDEYGNG